MAGLDRDLSHSDAAVSATLEPLMSIEDVAGVLRISERGVYRLISRGEVATLKVGHRTLIEPGEVRSFIASQRQTVDPTERSMPHD